MLVLRTLRRVCFAHCTVTPLSGNTMPQQLQWPHQLNFPSSSSAVVQSSNPGQCLYLPVFCTLCVFQNKSQHQTTPPVDSYITVLLVLALRIILFSSAGCWCAKAFLRSLLKISSPLVDSLIARYSQSNIFCDNSATH